MPVTNGNSIWSSPRTVTLASLAADKVCNDDLFTCCRHVRGGSAGNIVVQYVDSTGTTQTDTIPCLIGEKHDIQAIKILQTGTTAFPITIYY